MHTELDNKIKGHHQSFVFFSPPSFTQAILFDCLSAKRTLCRMHFASGKRGKSPTVLGKLL